MPLVRRGGSTEVDSVIPQHLIRIAYRSIERTEGDLGHVGAPSAWARVNFTEWLRPHLLADVFHQYALEVLTIAILA
jgi:hypothetical protein